MSTTLKSDSASSSSRSSAVTMDDNAALDLATQHTHESIRALLADEVPDLAEEKGLLVFNDPYLQISMKSFKLYINFLYSTWIVGVLGSIKPLLNKQMPLLDFVTLVFFSALVSSVLTMGVFMCLFSKLPLVEWLFGIHARLHGGFSFTNSLNTHMFSSLTKREVAHSKAALAYTGPCEGKHFNLEIAKMTLLLSSVIYERTSHGTRASLQAAHSVPKTRSVTPPGAKKSSRHNRTGSLTSSSPPASASPTATTFPITPISPVPVPMSATLQGRSRSARHTRLRSGGGSTSSQPFHLNFSNPPTPSALLDAFGKTATSHIRALLHGSEGDDVITKLVGRLGIEYEPVSELNSASSSYAAIFWEKRSNWVVLAFKGTSPSEFDEWLTDFDITRVHAGHRLPGYKEVHRGFKARLFPEDKSGAKRRGNPYETIMKALKVVTRDLMRWTDKDINVWFTGHSLGCAMATLTYTRALLGLDGLDPRVQLCDAYLFGAPVVCDMASAKVFNDFMTHRQSKTGRVRNVWRVTNRCDAVSTLLPMLGDDPLYPHPTSLFAYAHLGSEVKMRPGSGTSIIVDNYCSPGSVPARVVSAQEQIALERQRQREMDGVGAFGSDVETEVEGEGGFVEGYARRAGDERVGYGMSARQVANAGIGSARASGSGSGSGARKRRVKPYDGVPWWISMLEYVPGMGRMVSHFPGLYFRSLQQMEPGDFVWRRS